MAKKRVEEERRAVKKREKSSKECNILISTRHSIAQRRAVRVCV